MDENENEYKNCPQCGQRMEWVTCTECGGMATDRDGDPTDCPRCHNSGGWDVCPDCDVIT